MVQIPDWVNTLNSIAATLGTLVTAVATFFLWRVTKILANETTRMVEATSQPQVVATLEVNRWSMRHFNINVDNTGNATAYDIEIEFSPPLENGEGRTGGIEIPLRKISVLKPGHGASSYLTDYSFLEGKVFTVCITWRRHPKDEKKEALEYVLNMADHVGISQLGNDPLVQMAGDIRKLEQSIHQVAGGNTRIQVDGFSSSDRLHEQEESRRRYQERQQQRMSATPLNSESAGGATQSE